MTLGKKPFENIVGKGENAGNQHFLLFPQCFIPFPKQVSSFSNLLCRLQMFGIWTSIKIFGLVKSLLVKKLSDQVTVHKLTLYQTTKFWTEPDSKPLQATNSGLLKP